MAKVNNTDENKQERLANILSDKTPAQAISYIENNVTDLASAKESLKILAALVVALNNQIKDSG